MVLAKFTVKLLSDNIDMEKDTYRVEISFPKERIAITKRLKRKIFKLKYPVYEQLLANCKSTIKKHVG